MSSYRLTKSAENDLLEIWRYTCDKWSESQADIYLEGLEVVCESIGRGDVLLCRSMSEIHADLRFCLHERHYVFWLDRVGQPKLVVAFLHDKMDVVRHLADRADDEFQ